MKVKRGWKAYKRQVDTRLTACYLLGGLSVGT